MKEISNQIKLTNDFHNTTTFIRPKNFGQTLLISFSQAKRAQKALCGLKDCKCGDTFGSRGGTRLEVIDCDYDRKIYLVCTPSNMMP